MAKVYISTLPCILADGSRMAAVGGMRFVVWTDAFGDFGRDEATGRRRIGNGVTFPRTFEAAIEAASRYAKENA